MIWRAIDEGGQHQPLAYYHTKGHLHAYMHICKYIFLKGKNLTLISPIVSKVISARYMVAHDLEKSKFSLLYERSEDINLEQMLILYFVLT